VFRVQNLPFQTIQHIITTLDCQMVGQENVLTRCETAEGKKLHALAFRMSVKSGSALPRGDGFPERSIYDFSVQQIS